MKAQNGLLFCTVLSATLISITVLASAEFSPSDSSQSDSLEQIVKRPFCNAFTGCGRKRSESEIGSETDPSELLIQKLGQQILREAKMRGGLQTKIDLLALRNRLKNQLRGTQWMDYMGEQRRKRMAVANAGQLLTEVDES